MSDWQELLDRLAADPAVEPGFGLLSDRRHINVPPTTTYVRGSIDALAAHGDFFRSRRIAILTTDLATYGMARMAEVYAEGCRLAFKAFQDEEQAIAWASSKSAVGPD